MSANDFVDTCVFVATAGGTVDFASSGAVTGYQTPSGAGCVDGKIYTYRAQSADLTQWEDGEGAYTASTQTIARTTVRASSSGAKVSFTSPPQVAVVMLSSEIKALIRADVAQAFTSAQQDQARANINSNLRSYIDGLTLSTAGSSATFSVAAGQAMSADNATLMALVSSINKTTSAWAVGAAGALDTGTIANNTWYHAYLIERPDTGVVDVLISLSASAPTMPTNYTKKRRIGSIKTDGSAQWVSFTQNGDEFLWSSSVHDQNGVASSATAASVTLTVPTGIKVYAIVAGTYFSSSTAASSGLLFSSLDETDQTVTLGSSPVSVVGSSFGSASAYSGFASQIRTNTTAQIRERSSTQVGTLDLWTRGWIDARGKNA